MEEKEEKEKEEEEKEEEEEEEKEKVDIDDMFLFSVACYMTLHPALAVSWSVQQSVCLSVFLYVDVSLHICKILSVCLSISPFVGPWHLFFVEVKFC